MKNIYLLLFLFIGLSSCNQDDMGDAMDQEVTDQEFLEKFGTEVQRDFTGTLLTNGDQPVEGALVTINNKTAVSNAEGIFTINEATVRERFAYIKVESSEYFHASNAIVPTNGINTMRIRMIPKSFNYQVNSGQEETVGNSLASVTLLGNYVDENGGSYEGEVDVAMYYLDQSIENISEFSPGMPLVKLPNGDSKYISDYGTLLVELRGATGQKLNIAENSTAILTQKINGMFLSNAPATIKMGYFDEDLGYWVEEGQSSREGNSYVGEVSHFTFWQNLLPEDAIFLTINLVDENSTPLPYQNINIQSENNGRRGYITDNLGQVAGFVPINEQLEAMVVFNYIYCDNIIDSQDIGSFNDDTEITVTVLDQNFDNEESARTITGVLQNCNNEPIMNGIVKLRYGFQTLDKFVSDGTFSVTINQCDDNSEFEVTSYDITTETSSETEIYTITGDQTDIGTITSCSEIEEYIKFVVDENVEETFFSLKHQIVGGALNETNQSPRLNFLAVSPVTNHSYRFEMTGILNPNPYVGNYTYRDFNNPDAKGFTITPYRFGIFNGTPPRPPFENNNIIFNLIEVGEIGELITIEFSGDYQEEDGSSHFIEGIAKFLRKDQ